MRVMAVGVFDLLHAGHLHYLQQAKSLGNHLTVVVAHDDTVRLRKHEPVTNHDLRRRMVDGLKPVDDAIIGNPPDVSIFEILPKVNPDIIALGYDQEHAEDSIKNKLQELGYSSILVYKSRRPDRRFRRHKKNNRENYFSFTTTRMRY